MSRSPELAPEILDNVFSILANDRRNLGAVRLSSHEFNRIASPYLITRAVFAHRLPTLVRLAQLIEHPYFKHTITELFIDASVYDNDWGHWERTSAGKIKWATRKAEASAHLRSRTPEVPGTGQPCLYNPAMISETSILDRYCGTMADSCSVLKGDVPSVQELVHTIESSNRTTSTLRSRRDELCDKHPGLNEYRMRSKLFRHRKMKEVCYHLLRHSIRSFPMLVSLTFGDFRSLRALTGEHNSSETPFFEQDPGPPIFPISGAFGKDLFQAIAHAAVPAETSSDDRPALVYPELPDIDRTKSANLKIRAISLARSAPSEATELRGRDSLSSHRISIGPAFFNEFSNYWEPNRKCWATLFENLTNLDLEFLMKERPKAPGEPRIGLANIIKIASPSLRRLTLRHKSMPYTRPLKGSITLFSFIFGDLLFPNLNYLELAGSKIRASEMITFLEGHRSTLGKVLLHDNFIEGHIENMVLHAQRHLAADTFELKGTIEVNEEELASMELPDEEDEKCVEYLYDWRGTLHRIRTNSIRGGIP